MDLPDNPSELAALFRRIEERARDLADQQDRVAFDQRPEPVREAVACAVDTLYFYGDGRGEHGAALLKILALLAPEISTVMGEQGADVAYRILHPEEEP